MQEILIFEEENSLQLEKNHIILDELKRFMNEQIFDREIAVEYEWSGIMAFGPQHQKTPIVKEIAPNVILAARLGGMGVALSATVAKDVLALLS